MAMGFGEKKPVIYPNGLVAFGSGDESVPMMSIVTHFFNASSVITSTSW
jgi:hypothetical protein